MRPHVSQLFHTYRIFTAKVLWIFCIVNCFCIPSHVRLMNCDWCVLKNILCGSQLWIFNFYCWPREKVTYTLYFQVEFHSSWFNRLFFKKMFSLWEFLYGLYSVRVLTFFNYCGNRISHNLKSPKCVKTLPALLSVEIWNYANVNCSE